MKQLQRLLTIAPVVIGALYVGVPVAAHATNITTSSDLLVTFTGNGGGVTGTATAELSDFMFGTGANSNQVTFKMDVTNTTTSLIDTRFTAFGWDTTPTATVVSDDSNVYVHEGVAPISLPGVSLSVCLYAGPTCQGGSNGGLEDPANAGLHGDPVTTGIFNVTMTFATNVPPLDFSSFLGKFQTAEGSFEAPGTVCVTGCDPVPEPASLALFGVGLLGLGFVTAKRRN